jgi:hypothetical protein
VAVAVELVAQIIVAVIQTGFNRRLINGTKYITR